MTQENANKKNVKKVRFNLVVLLVLLSLSIYILARIYLNIRAVEHFIDHAAFSTAKTARMKRPPTNPKDFDRFMEGLDDYSRGAMLRQAAAVQSSTYALQHMIENGADVNAHDDNGVTPLMCAASRNSNPDVLRFLIENGATVNAFDSDGATSLMMCAKNNSNPEVLRVLIENGANIHFKDRYGKKALDYAMHNKAFNRTDILRELGL